MKGFICIIAALLCCFNLICADALSTSALSSVLIDGNTGEVLYASNENTRRSMASTTKIMTALLLCENKDLNDKLFITKEMVGIEGTSIGLKIGDEVAYKDILYGMLLSSGNDAANAAAVGISGNIESFVLLMNKKANEIGLLNTHFDTPSGLDGKTHYTTALDLAVLSRYALHNKDFAKVCATKIYECEYGGTKHIFKNHNRLLNTVEGAVGVKTGFTKKSGRCLVSAARRNGVLLIAVTLNDRDDWKDHKSLLEYGFKNTESKDICFEKELFSVNVISGKEKTVSAESKAEKFRVNCKSDIKRKVYKKQYVYAPVKKGECIGYVEYISGDFVISKQKLLALKSVEQEDEPLFYKKYLKNVKIILGEVL